jgi:peptidoglycan/xylan/chitin deacetylase (PgdA/CDA1 family)
MSELPHYYSSLSPFREVFLTGQPVLTYHHVGRRKRGARLKGLYVSPKLFGRQMAELKEDGYSSGKFTGFSIGKSGQKKEVFLTFDDGFVDVFENALPILRKNGFTGIQFLVSDLLGKTNEWQQRQGDVVEKLMDETQVRAWLEAGQEIGAHTRTHPRLTRVSLKAAREEIVGSRKSLEDRFGLPIEHFCYPFGDWNEAVRDVVIEAGYKTAFTTLTAINKERDSLFELKRFTARYPTRSFKSVWKALKSKI